MEWISVKDRLPEALRTVLIYSSKTKEVHCIQWQKFTHEMFLEFTHWMPLPEPPRK